MKPSLRITRLSVIVTSAACRRSAYRAQYRTADEFSLLILVIIPTLMELGGPLLKSLIAGFRP